MEWTELNGCPAVIARAPRGEIETVVLIEADPSVVQAVRIVRSPDKLAHL